MAGMRPGDWDSASSSLSAASALADLTWKAGLPMSGLITRPSAAQGTHDEERCTCTLPALLALHGLQGLHLQFLVCIRFMMCLVKLLAINSCCDIIC